MVELAEMAPKQKAKALSHEVRAKVLDKKPEGSKQITVLLIPEAFEALERFAESQGLSRQRALNAILLSLER